MASPSALPQSSAAPPTDVVVVGSGAAALSAALAAAAGGATVRIIEKSDKIGGTSAMSGAGTWIPVNHHALAAGLEDSADEAMTYLRAASPAGWDTRETPLWESFVAHAPEMLQFLERTTPLRFALVDEPDPQAERPGGKKRGRMLSPRPLSRRLVGAYAGRIRRSTLPQLFTYQEMVGDNPYGTPVRAVLRHWPRLLRRLLTQERGQGNALIVGLLRGCLDHGCTVDLETRVVDLVVDDATGRVEGVEVERRGGGADARERILARRGVVLATGGFEWDEELFPRHFPGPAGPPGSPPTNTGDGQKMAARVGAALERMDQANIYPVLPTFYEGRSHVMPATFQAHPHAIVVDRTGRRFVSEYDYNIGEALDRRDPATGAPVHLPCWVLGDARFLRHPRLFRWYARRERGWLRRAQTIEALAAAIDLPAAALKETVERFNGFAHAGRDTDFRRGESVWERYKAHAPEGTANPTLGTIERAPFVAAPLNRTALGTKGGARTNARGEVLRPDGSIIPGLHCAGNAMANPIGTRAVGAGTTIGPCLTWGYICGINLLRGNR